MSDDKRPDWVKNVERTPNGTFMVVEGTDGVHRGVRIPSQSIRPPDCGIEERIAGVLRREIPDHVFSAAAVASVLAAELGITEQWGLKSGNNPPNTMKSEALAKDRAQRWPESFTAVYRYTTPWENA
jgi:hypothetical protein